MLGNTAARLLGAAIFALAAGGVPAVAATESAAAIDAHAAALDAHATAIDAPAATGAAAVAAATDTFELARRYPAGSGTLRLEINKSERELYIFVDDERVHWVPIAIGQPDHPTPTGEFSIHQVDWNPDWTPPDSEWSEDREYKEPGEDGNPMGRARLIYRAPYSLHGTEALESLGEAASHGSVRVANEEIIGIARLVQEHGGAERSEEWYRNAVGTPTEMFEVRLSNPVTLLIYE
jgi:lipoprotein-anchoring transpeptidase ErfK/SrfK